MTIEAMCVLLALQSSASVPETPAHRIERLEARAQSFAKHAPIVVALRDGSQIVGRFGSVRRFDDVLWIQEPGHFLAQAVYMTDVVDIKLDARRPI